MSNPYICVGVIRDNEAIDLPNIEDYEFASYALNAEVNPHDPSNLLVLAPLNVETGEEDTIYSLSLKEVEQLVLVCEAALAMHAYPILGEDIADACANALDGDDEATATSVQVLLGRLGLGL